VIIGIHQEERRWSLNSGRAPSLIAQLARIVLGCEVRRVHEGRSHQRDKIGQGTRL